MKGKLCHSLQLAENRLIGENRGIDEYKVDLIAVLQEEQGLFQSLTIGELKADYRWLFTKQVKISVNRSETIYFGSLEQGPERSVLQIGAVLNEKSAAFLDLLFA